MKRLLLATVALIIIAGGTFFFLGYEPEPDPEEVQQMKLIRKFNEILAEAEAGDAQSQLEAARMLEDGDGIGKNMREAAKWYMRAAEQGLPDARYKVGWMYDNGIGLRQDYFQAAKWYRLASTFDHHVEAQYALGNLYFNGRGIEHDYAKAIQYFKLAASKGHGTAQFLLGSMYMEGWGVDRDLMAAYMWLKLSNDGRDKSMFNNSKYSPNKKLAELSDRMNNFQIEEAEKRLVELRRQVQANTPK